MSGTNGIGAQAALYRNGAPGGHALPAAQTGGRENEAFRHRTVTGAATITATNGSGGEIAREKLPHYIRLFSIFVLILRSNDREC